MIVHIHEYAGSSISNMAITSNLELECGTASLVI